jgi:hypothetical protein
MTWVAVAIGGSALVGAGASYLGSKKQAQGAEKAAGINMDMFNVLNRQQQPFIGGGYGAMGRLNTLLGINPNPGAPRASTPLTMPHNSGYRITPGGGIDQMLQVDPSQQHDVFAGGPGGDPRGGGNVQLRQLLALRAAHGDRQAQAILQGNV